MPEGWYGRKWPQSIYESPAPADALTGPGKCGPNGSAAKYQGRCGYGPRLPLLVISPYAKPNFVDHTQTDQTSILRFIEDNWGLGRIGDHSMDELAGPLDGMFDFTNGGGTKAVTLDPKTGEVAGGEEANAD